MSPHLARGCSAPRRPGRSAASSRTRPRVRRGSARARISAPPSPRCSSREPRVSSPISGAWGPRRATPSAVWAGNFDGRAVINKTGSVVPARIVVEILERITRAASDFAMPDSMREQRICSLSGGSATPRCPATRAEFFASRASLPGPCAYHGVRAFPDGAARRRTSSWRASSSRERRCGSSSPWTARCCTSTRQPRLTPSRSPSSRQPARGRPWRSSWTGRSSPRSPAASSPDACTARGSPGHRPHGAGYRQDHLPRGMTPRRRALAARVREIV